MQDESAMKDSYQPPLLRWFILLWMGIIYIWGLGLQGLTDDKLTPDALTIFTVLMVLHTSIHWLYLSGLLSRIRQRGLVLMCVLQGLIALGICMVGHEWDVSISLYLTLLLEASTFQRRTRFIAMGSYLVFLVLAIVSLSFLGTHQFGEALRSIVGPASLFAAGYIVLYFQQVNARKHAQTLLHDLEIAHAQLSAYAVHVEDLTLATERQRMARELHDTLVQGLAGLTIQLEVVNLRLTNQRYEQAQALIQQAMERTRSALAEARNVIYDLRLDTEQADDLVLAVQKEIEHFHDVTGIVCQTDIEALASIPPALRMHVQRMISEGLTNVVRHAQAQHVRVCAVEEQSASGKKLRIEVRDDGKGFDPGVVATQVGHYGLIGLRERARLLDGKLEIHSEPGEGTTLQLYIPDNDGDWSDE